MNMTLRDLSDENFFDSESRSLAFHQMRRPTALDVVGLTALIGFALVVATPFIAFDKIRGFIGR